MSGPWSRVRVLAVILTVLMGISALPGCSCQANETPRGDAGPDDMTDASHADAGPCSDGSPRGLVLRDADGDGFGDLTTTDPQGCAGPGWVTFPVDARLDCNDGDARATPDALEYCDFDSDGAIGLEDCDDHNRRRRPNAIERCNGIDDDCDGRIDDEDQDGRSDPAATWAQDEDEDGYASVIVLACVDPGPEWVLWGERTTEPDCAPLDPDVHPNRMDNCATEADASCDGVFRPVYVGYTVNISGGERTDFAAEFTKAGESGPPTEVTIPGDYRITIDLCPGTYRVLLNLGDYFAWNTDFVVRGHGDSPEDVVLDAAHQGRNVIVPAWANLDQVMVPSRARLENLTITGGRAPDGERGGCLLQSASWRGGWLGSGELTLERVVLRDCQAEVGGALAVESNNALVMTDVVFEDAHATQRGGALDFEGTSMTMTGGSFGDVSAPAGSGAAISAALPAEQTLTLQSVDLGAVVGDIALRTATGTLLRDLGDAASLVCSPTACTP